MDFYDPVSELISVSPTSSNRRPGTSPQFPYESPISFDYRPRIADLTLRLPTTPVNPPGSAESMTLGPEVVYQRPLPDGLSEELVDVRLPGGATRREVWEWIKGLGEPRDMDPDKLLGPIVAQEDIPTGANAAEGSGLYPPSEESRAPDPGQTRRRGFQEIVNPTRTEALPTRVNTTRIEGRAFNTEGSQVDRIIQYLRDIASDDPRRSSDGLLASDDAAHGQGSAQYTQTRQGLATSSQRPHPSDLGSGGEFLARRTRVASLLARDGYASPSYMPYNGGLQDVFDEFSIYRDSDCREDDAGGGGAEKTGRLGDDVLENSQGSTSGENIIGDSLLGQVGSCVDRGRDNTRDEGRERETYVSVFSSRDGSSDGAIDGNEASVDRNRRQEAMARRRRRYGVQFQTGPGAGSSLPRGQHRPLGATLPDTADAAGAFPTSFSSSWSSGGFGGTFPYHVQSRSKRVGQSGGQRESSNSFAHNGQSTGDGDKGPEQPSPVGSDDGGVTVYYGAEIVDVDRLDPLPPLPSLFPDLDSHQPSTLGHTTPVPQPLMSETTQAQSQASAHSGNSRPFILGADLLDDPFVRTPEPQGEQQHLQPGDTHQTTDSPRPGTGGTDQVSGLADLFARTPGSPFERPLNPGGFRHNSQARRRVQVQQPFVLGLDTIHHPFSDTPIVPDEPWSANTTLRSRPLSTVGRADSDQGVHSKMPHTDANAHEPTRSIPSRPASSKGSSDSNGNSAARKGRPTPSPKVASHQQLSNKEPQRVELEDSAEAIERPVGSPLPASEPSEGGQSGSDKGEAEPRFPEQVYNVLLVGAEGVGQTSMIQSHVNGHWTDAVKVENSLRNKFLRREVNKNRVYRMDAVVDSYRVKLVLWDASLRCAGDMLRRNDAGWDAVVLCCNLVEPLTLQEVMKWYTSHRAEIRPATALPVVIELAGLKRDLLHPVRHRLSRKNGEHSAGWIGGGTRYTEASAWTRENFREFWYGVVRRVRDGRVRAHEGEVRRWWRRRGWREGEGGYWEVEGKRADLEL